MDTFLHAEFQGMKDGLWGMKDELRGMNNEFRGLNDKFYRLGSPNQAVPRERLLVWLNAVFTVEELEMALNSQTQETCRWILQRDKFQDWASPTTATDAAKVLWIHGPPGFGKTVLCASIVKHLRDQNPSRVAYFFCVSEDEAKRQPLAIVRSWVAQMVDQNEEAQEAAREAYHGKEGRSATTLDVWQLFRRICQRMPNCFFVVDGFDECIKIDQTTGVPSTPEALRFWQPLIDTAKDTPSCILFVSREDADMRSRFRKLAESSPDAFLECEISASDTQNDVKSFATSVVAENLPKKKGDLREELAENASQRCQGMFLWVRLLGNRLNPGKNAKQLREVVREMPIGIEKTYESDLKRISNLGDERDRAIAILRWTLFARRPLTVRELTEALVVKVDDDCGVYPRDDLPDAWDEDVNDQIQRLCGSLIELRGREEQHLPPDQTVHLVHFSVREYLLSATTIHVPSPRAICLSDTARENDLLSRICLRYMSYNDLTEETFPSKEDIQRKMGEYKFLRYAASFWYIHARNNAEWSEKLVDLTNGFFEPNGSRLFLWSTIFEQGESAEEATTVPGPTQLESISPVYYSSLLGFINPLRHLRKQGIDCNARGRRDDSALHAAALNGHVEVVKYLIEQQAEVDVKDQDGLTPLHAAAYNGHMEVAKYLIEQQAEVNVKDQHGQTPLHAAA